MACVDENCLYPGKNKSMEDDMLTLEGMSDHMPRIGGYSGVRIREFDDGNVNPEPVKRDDKNTEDLWEEFLSPNKLKSLSGVSNLDDATCLEMLVNTDEQSLGNFGAMLPNLVQLKLSNSVISTVRDLGTSLGNLKILWMSQCGLTDLDGISSLSSLVELFVAFNDINDVSPVSMLDNLEVLDLEGNLIDDLSQVEFLSLCSSLKSLNLEGNPVCVAPHANSSAEEMAGYEYRKSIHQAVPRLKILDDEPFLVEKVGGKDVLRDMPESAKSARVPNHSITLLAFAPHSLFFMIVFLFRFW
ncbi:leucine-rich repeat-containing protein 56-like [Actinia tenebrosa]|uniref:Leucine-rich repeat-containing protein 56-like n=1 Tax=Actinia tenebrosa TaxID=6105 RepID=A0A6P8JC22_ACTTE|nr:leucine-rich repeat-containing protein 56-like [Actinia tenebrosa]